MSRESPVKCWCFTYHPEQEDESLHEWLEYQWQSGLFTYLVGQAERGAETGKVHLQGFAVLGTKRRLAQMKKINARAHWEAMKGTMAQARAYAMKADTRLDGPWEYGEIRGAGRPSTLELVGDMVKAGKSDQDIATEAPTVYMRNYKGIQALRIALKITNGQRSGDPEVWVLWGPSRTGKSAFARHNWPDAYWKPKDRQGTYWWGGYVGQDTVVLDDMDGSRMTFTDCKNLLDRYPLTVDYKGGQLAMLAKRYVITTNVHPQDWYKIDTAGTIMGRVVDFAQGRFVYCGPDAWTDAFTGALWEPPTEYSVPDFVRAKWAQPQAGAVVPDFPGNTSGNPAPGGANLVEWEAWREELQRRG